MCFPFIALSESIIYQHLLRSDPLTLSLQVGDAGDPELLDAPTIGPGGVEEPDGYVRNSALPQHGKVPVLRSREDQRELMQTPL